MTCVRIPNGVVCVSPEHEVTDANGRVWRFEMHSLFGPTVVHKRTGQPLATQPNERSPFWPAFKAWNDARREGR